MDAKEEYHFKIIKIIHDHSAAPLAKTSTYHTGIESMEEIVGQVQNLYILPAFGWYRVPSKYPITITHRQQITKCQNLDAVQGMADFENSYCFLQLFETTHLAQIDISQLQMAQRNYRCKSFNSLPVSQSN